MSSFPQKVIVVSDLNDDMIECNIIYIYLSNIFILLKQDIFPIFFDISFVSL